jgi:WXG100 family type VII secretion target
MGTSQANFRDMGVAAEFFQAAIDDCYTTRTKMGQTIQTVRWDGPASIAYNGAMNEWNVKFDTVVRELERIRDVLDLNKGNYQTNEDTNTQTTSLITQGLNGVPQV